MSEYINSLSKYIKDTVDELVHFAQDYTVPGKDSDLKDTDGKSASDRYLDDAFSEDKPSFLDDAKDFTQENLDSAKAAIHEANETSLAKAKELVHKFIENKSNVVSGSEIDSREDLGEHGECPCSLFENSEISGFRKELEKQVESKLGVSNLATEAFGITDQVIDQQIEKYESRVQTLNNSLMEKMKSEGDTPFIDACYVTDEMKRKIKDEILGPYNLTIFSSSEGGGDLIGHAWIQCDYPNEAGITVSCSSKELSKTKYRIAMSTGKGAPVCWGWYPTGGNFVYSDGAIIDDSGYGKGEIKSRKFKVYLEELEQSLNVMKRYNTKDVEVYNCFTNQCAHFAINVLEASGHKYPWLHSSTPMGIMDYIEDQ